MMYLSSVQNYLSSSLDVTRNIERGNGIHLVSQYHMYYYQHCVLKKEIIKIELRLLDNWKLASNVLA